MNAFTQRLVMNPLSLSLATGLAWLSLLNATAAAAEPAPAAATVVAVEGLVEASHDGGQNWSPVKRGTALALGHVLRVGARSRAALRLPDQTVVRLDQHASLSLIRDEQHRPLIQVLKGAVYFFSRTPRAMKVATPFVNGTIEGTEFLVRVGLDAATLTVFEGWILASNPLGTLRVDAGQAAVASANAAPRRELAARPDDAVAWALYYPPILSVDEAALRAQTPEAGRTALRRAILAANAGDAAAALTDLDAIPEWDRHAGLLAYRASLLLAVGRADEAATALTSLRKLDDRNAPARALGAVIAVARGDRDAALQQADEALRLDPRSAEARIALSYVRQTAFKLGEALRIMEECVVQQPANAQAWARLAELRLVMGQRVEAMKAADRAASLAPDLERVHTVRGFAHLAATDAKRAREAFGRASTLAPDAPLPRLGLGLAEIRAGRLAAGREELEAAVALSPRDALLRSYLGKAYFEEFRDEKAVAQFTQARELDPRDPTPYLYDAVRAQSANDPVGALQDLYKAQALNDNRAVFRSRLLLDEDLAMRAIGLARTYRELGFERRALVEGWNALDLDPANHSAHRFLADSYAAQPNSEISRASELLVSQLLQPINALPIQPGLGERRPASLGNTDPLTPAFNEYSSLFVSDGARALLSLAGGDHGTIGEEAIATVQAGRHSFSVGQLYESSRGYRDNNQQRLRSYDLLGQVSVTPELSVQAGYQYRDVARGDVAMYTGPDLFSPTLHETVVRETGRVGLHYEPAPNLDLLVSSFYQTLDGDVDDRSPVGFPPDSSLRAQSDDACRSGEIQLISQHRSVRLVVGGGYYDADLDELARFAMGEESAELADDQSVGHANAYAYGYVRVAQGLLLTAGLSGDRFRGEPRDVDQLNPKAGLAWRPTPNTQIRAAAFRTLARSLVSSQTIEPTSVAGFLQFFDDSNGTASWRYGAGLDQFISERLMLGAEITFSTPSTPAMEATETGDPLVRRYDFERTNVRAYGYWTPRDFMTLTAEYFYDETNPEDPNIPFAHDMETHRAPIGCRFFLPHGFTPRLQLTYTDQTGELPDPVTRTFVHHSERSWILDLALGYRLPKRAGLVTVEARNLLDVGFVHDELDPRLPVSSPERSVLAKMTLAF